MSLPPRLAVRFAALIVALVATASFVSQAHVFQIPHVPQRARLIHVTSTMAVVKLVLVLAAKSVMQIIPVWILRLVMIRVPLPAPSVERFAALIVAFAMRAKCAKRASA